ncbi:MAG: glycosyltransferase family 2 protein [Gaiellaceae bacterium]
MSRIAVVIPCFNDGATLREALASIDEPCETIVVDDGSTDPATLALLDELRADGVNVVRQANGGLAAARMAGVAASSAPYIQPLDADDVLTPGALTALAHALDTDPRAAAAWGDVEFFGEFELVAQSADRLDPWTIWYLDELPGTSMVRRTVLEQTGGWRLADAYEDWDFWMTVAEHGLDGVRVPAVAFRYRRDPERMSAGGLARHGELLAQLRARHPELRRRLRRHWLRSTAPLRMRLLYPLIELAPLSGQDRHRARRLVAHPRRMLAHRRIRRAASR